MSPRRESVRHARRVQLLRPERHQPTHRRVREAVVPRLDVARQSVLVRDVRYEDVVEDLEPSVRRVLGFCGLEFEPACVEFHKTERHVSTASSEQVRRPIFREGLSQWRHYEQWLGPLKEALGDALERLCPLATQSEIASRD
jgi:hypothetical protein